MKLTGLIIFLTIHLIESKISITFDEDFKSIIYSGAESEIATNKDIELFFQDTDIREAVKKHYGKRPTNVYFKSPTPWGGLYKTYKWEQVKKITTVKSIKINNLKKEPLVYTEDFENNSDKTIKVNTGISHTIENTLTTRWSKTQELSLTQEFQYGVELLSAKTGISFTTTWGKDEEKSEAVTFGSTTSMETELKPHQAVTSKLTLNTGRIEIEVTYKTSLRGNLAVNFKRKYKNHSFWAPQVQDVMKSAGIVNEKTFFETVPMGITVDAKLVVLDKVTGNPV